MKISDKGLALIKRWEGCRLTAYRDVVGVLTIGYGSTGPHVKPGMVITQSQADALLLKDVARFELGVNAMASKFTQGQFDAIVALSFNIGLGNLASSTLLKKHKAGDYAAAADNFGKWVNAGGKRLEGLARRRADEKALYLS